MNADTAPGGRDAAAASASRPWNSGTPLTQAIRFWYSASRSKALSLSSSSTAATASAVCRRGRAGVLGPLGGASRSLFGEVKMVSCSHDYCWHS